MASLFVCLFLSYLNYVLFNMVWYLLSPTRHLEKLDLSYNFISDLSGLKTLGQGHSCLTTLYLQGNQVASIDHVINCLDDHHQLKYVVFVQNSNSNPVCCHPKYRSLVLSMLSNLEILDGYNRSGQQVEIDCYSENPILTGMFFCIFFFFVYSSFPGVHLCYFCLWFLGSFFDYFFSFFLFPLILYFTVILHSHFVALSYFHVLILAFNFQLHLTDIDDLVNYLISSESNDSTKVPKV